MFIVRFCLECVDVWEVFIIVCCVGFSLCDGVWGGGVVDFICREIVIVVLFDGGLDIVFVG